MERYESDIEEEGGASASSHTHKNVVKGEKQLMLVISERFLEERSSMGDKVKCAKYGECVVYSCAKFVYLYLELHVSLSNITLKSWGQGYCSSLNSFLKFFLRLLDVLISECANMRVQFKGGNKIRVGTINIAALPMFICALYSKQI